jgi:hypothetical protein
VSTSRSAFLSSCSGLSLSEARSSLKAASVGAKTVATRDVSLRTAVRPAASIAATRVVSLAATAVS